MFVVVFALDVLSTGSQKIDVWSLAVRDASLNLVSWFHPPSFLSSLYTAVLKDQKHPWCEILWGWRGGTNKYEYKQWYPNILEGPDIQMEAGAGVKCSQDIRIFSKEECARGTINKRELGIQRMRALNDAQARWLQRKYDVVLTLGLAPYPEYSAG